MSETIFTKIINREIPGHFIYEDEVCVAILDAFPAVAGQTLVIPREPVDYVFDLDDATYLHVFAVAKKIATALDIELKTERTCMVLEGFEVPHAHLKLYPVPDTTPLGQVLPNQTKGDPESLAALATQLKTALADTLA
ncbi:HIT family protein [bacterium]|nr:HIT family protein [bacterium]|tara:strand:- start:550 stop:963 length:414 start_codon:yes stop_codon:yes gene_type:complete